MGEAIPVVEQKTRASGFAFLLAAGIIWGTIGVGARYISDNSTFEAMSITWLRAVVATPVCIGFGLLVLGRDLFRFSRRNAAIMVLAGVVLIYQQWLYLRAVEFIGVARTELLALGLPPVMVAIISAALLGEHLGRKGWTAIAMSITGLVLLMGWEGIDGVSRSDQLTGLAIGLLCAMFGTVYFMTSKLLAGRVHPIQALTVGFPAGAIAFAPVALASGISLRQPANAWGAVIYLGAVTSVLAYAFYLRGAREVSATVASIVILVEPVTAAILARIFFDERLGPLGLVGALLLMGAILILSRASSPAKPVARVDDLALESNGD